MVSKSLNADTAMIFLTIGLFRAGSGYSTMKDLLASSKSSSPIREKASMGISVMKSLVLREKDDKMIQEFGSDDKVHGLMNALLNAGR